MVLRFVVKLVEGWCEMALPGIAAAAALRAGAKKVGKKLAEKEAPIVVGGAGATGGSYISAAESAKKREEESTKKREEESDKEERKSAMMSGAGLGAAAGAAAGKGAQGLGKTLAKPGLKNPKYGTKEYEVPTEENMNRPKATRPGGADSEISTKGLNRKMREEGYRPFKKGGSVSSASKRADGCAVRGKTKGRMV
jgi:hypothetical protein